MFEGALDTDGSRWLVIDGMVEVNPFEWVEPWDSLEIIVGGHADEVEIWVRDGVIV